MTTVWNAADKSANITLSNTDHTATSGGGSGNEGVRATTSKSAGKWYIEFTNIDTGGFSFGLGFGPSSASLTGGSIPEFRLTGNSGINIPGGGSFAGASTNPTGDTVAFAIDLDGSPKRGWMQFNGTWYGNAGALGAPPSPGDSSGFDLTGLTTPWFPTVWLQFNPCTCDINAGDLSFVNAAPAGFTAWDTGGTGGSAGGSTLTSTVTFIPGSGNPAPGSTITPVVSLIPGAAHTSAIDGTKLFEFATALIAAEVYQEVDYNSIYGRGDRVASGLLVTGEYGWASVLAPFSQAFDDNFAPAVGNGPATTGTAAGAAYWLTTAAGETLDLRGVTFAGCDNIPGAAEPYALYGGISPGVYSGTPYTAGIDAFNNTQDLNLLPAPPADLATYQDEIAFEPRAYAPFAHYEIVYLGGTRSGSRFCNELWLKLAHSNLDGGDRRPTAPASKRVAFTASADWAFIAGSDFDVPQQAWFDGKWEYSGGKKKVGPGQAANTANPVTAVGAWFQFVFPRPVKPKHIQFVNFNLAVETYTGPDPDHYGRWHWEYSTNSGGSWTSIGTPWSFRENCVHMVAPREPDFALPAMDDDGATHWRMVLDQGPAWGSGRHSWQIIFDLEDVSGLAPPFTVDFTDDEDAVPAVVTLGPPGSPYVVALSDGSDDGLTATVTNIPNPVLTVAFTDDGTFDTWSDLYPSVVVQTIVVATGR